MLDVTDAVYMTVDIYITVFCRQGSYRLIACHFDAVSYTHLSYRAMFEALEDTIRAKDNRLAELRDILFGTQKPGFRELYPVRFPWLNSTPETAVNKVLCTRDVSIVHGPPGTGKDVYKRQIHERQVPTDVWPLVWIRLSPFLL